jgi:type III secretion system (T3SS) SseB-like protein
MPPEPHATRRRSVTLKSGRPKAQMSPPATQPSETQRAWTREIRAEISPKAQPRASIKRRWVRIPTDDKRGARRDRHTSKALAGGMLIVYQRDRRVATRPDRSLAAAIELLAEAGPDEISVRFRAVLDQLIKAKLLIGEDSIVETEDGEELLALFTDPVELFAFDTSGAQETITGEEAIRRVADEDYDGLVINPKGRSFELAREDILEIFEIDEE